MKRDDLVDFTDEQKDLVMSLYGKAITKKDKEIETLNNSKKELENKISTYETKINEFNESAKDNADWKSKYEELQTSIEKQEAEQKAKAEDDILTKNINEVFGDKKFVNDFTKNAIVDEIKTALKDSANMGKSAKDLFEEITKGKDGIFANPNPKIDMPGVDEGMESTVTKEAFDKMGYKERVEFKQSNHELFNKYNNE
jgi:DNA repair exonuclease SbcCD ATPase subunit